MNPIDYIVSRIRSLDPKLVAAGVAYPATLAVTRVGFELTDPLIPGFVTYAQAIAAVGALAAGYFASNDGTVVRETEPEDGNAAPPEDFDPQAAYSGEVQ